MTIWWEHLAKNLSIEDLGHLIPRMILVSLSRITIIVVIVMYDLRTTCYPHIWLYHHHINIFPFLVHSPGQGAGCRKAYAKSFTAAPMNRVAPEGSKASAKV